MKCREFIWAGVNEENPYSFPRFRIEFASARNERVIFEEAAVEHDAVELPIEHGLNIVGILEVLRLDQDIFPVRLRPGTGVLGIDDDGAEHAAGDMLNHR